MNPKIYSRPTRKRWKEQTVRAPSSASGEITTQKSRLMNSEIIFDDASRVLEVVDFAPLDGATVFITGATGLLGTHFLASLCLLKDKGMKIKVFAEHHSAPANYTVDIARRGNFMLLNEIPKGADVVIHAAGYAQPSV